MVTNLRRIEEDLAARMESLFERCPALYGFTVQDCALLGEEPRSLDQEPVRVTDLCVFPVLGSAQCEAIYNEIAETLLGFLSEQPAAKDLVCGHTIVRVLH